MKVKGFSLIELMVVIAIFSIFAVAVIGQLNGSSDISYGFNGVTETRCIGGYKHTIGEGGQARQMLNENGGGVKC